MDFEEEEPNTSTGSAIRRKRRDNSQERRESEEFDENDVPNEDIGSVKSEEVSNSLIIDDKTNRRLIRKKMITTRISPVRMYSKDSLIRVGCNAFAYHRLSAAARLLPAIVLDVRSSHSFIIKSAFIIFTQNPKDCSLLIKSMKKLSKYDVNKREIMLEVIVNFIRNKDIFGAKNYIESNQSYLNMNLCRKNKLIDTYLQCYISFADYLDWKQSIEEINDNLFYQSNRVIAEKTKLSLKNIITETKDLILDQFVLTLIEMYEYSEQFSDAYEILQVYLDNNRDHLNAYIYLYNFSVKYPDYSNPESKDKALKYIFRHSCDNPFVLDLVRSESLPIEDKFEILSEFVDHKHNFNDINAWSLLKDLICSISDKSVKRVLRKQWKDVFEEYWVRLHFNAKRIKQIDSNVIELIGYKQKVIEFFCSSSHPFVIQTNQMIEEFDKII